MKKYWSQIILWFFIITYIIYFSYFTILRYQTLYASYFDLGIMHQTVYNTYRALATFDWSRFLELTNPYGPEQIKRMAIHNDVLLVLFAPFYFIHAGPETLLVIQTVIVALGALVVYKLTLFIFKSNQKRNILALVFVFSYLIYSPIQRSNIYEFHAVTLSTSFIIFMFYFWLTKRYVLSSFFLILSLLSKEQVALTTLFFGLYILSVNLKSKKPTSAKFKKLNFPLFVIVISGAWFALSILLIIPTFRGSGHFALSYYNDIGRNLPNFIFHIDTARYLFFLLGPLGFLSLLSPAQLLIALPEFAINLLSSSWHMRNIIFHYTAVIQPFVFIASICGAQKLINYLQGRLNSRSTVLVAGYIVVFSLLLAYFKGPLPFSREKEVHPFLYPQRESEQISYWKNLLRDERLKVSTTGQLAPHFTSRRYFYDFSKYYYLADYIVLRPGEIYNYPDKEKLIPVYNRLVNDPQYIKIYKQGGLEVYRKLTQSF